MFVKEMAVFLSLLVGAALQAVAQPGPGGPGGFARFNLTEDQQTKVREARQASESERAQLFQKLGAAQKEAITAALAEKPDEKTIRVKVEEVTKLQAEVGLLSLKNFKDVKFTEEQKEQLTSRPALGYMVLFGGMGPGGMLPGMGGGPGGPRRGDGPAGGGAAGASRPGGVTK